MALTTAMAIIGGAAIAGTAAVASTAMAGSAAEKQAKAAKEAAAGSTAAQLKIAEEAKLAAQMTPEEKAYQSMLMKRAEEGLGAPEFESTTAQETEVGLEALQKYYMQRGFQPSPKETGLLIEPSQKIARDVAIQNALLRRQAQQQAWENAARLYPQQQRTIEQGAPLATAGAEMSAAGYPGQVGGQLAMQNLSDIQASQKALGGMLAAYSSPLLQSRIQGGGGTNIGGPRVDPSNMSRNYWQQV